MMRVQAGVAGVPGDCGHEESYGGIAVGLRRAGNGSHRILLAMRAALQVATFDCRSLFRFEQAD